MQSILLEFWRSHSETVIKIVYNSLLALSVLGVSAVLARIVKKITYKAIDTSKSLDNTLIPIISSTSAYVIYILGIVIILDIFGVNTASIIALLGAAGLAVGFALKDTLSNIAAGIMLLFLRPFKEGDFIEFSSYKGFVKEINLFTTILETIDGVYVSSPNGVVWGNTIVNYTRNGKRRLDVTIGISYGDSIDKGMQVLKRVIESDDRLMKDPAPQAIVYSMGDSSVNLQLRAWTDVNEYWNIHWDLNKKVKEEIEKSGLTIPFPQVDVHMKTEKD